jgi:hypothetical protein
VTHVEKPTFEVEAHFELKDRRVVALGQSVAASFALACECERSMGPASEPSLASRSLAEARSPDLQLAFCFESIQAWILFVSNSLLAQCWWLISRHPKAVSRYRALQGTSPEPRSSFGAAPELGC